jgi:ATP-dependent NAD(P)H-hydrate dehydratase
MNIRKLWLIDIIDICKEIIPTLVFNSHKGQNGRIGILGGSIDYTGAPYYAGQSALKYGADLAYIFCAKEASIPIKSYSPELVVTPFYDSEVICSKIIDEKMKQVKF